MELFVDFDKVLGIIDLHVLQHKAKTADVSTQFEAVKNETKKLRSDDGCRSGNWKMGVLRSEKVGKMSLLFQGGPPEPILVHGVMSN